MKNETGIFAGLGCGMLLLVLALVLAIQAAVAYGAQYVLAAFGVTVGFWPCFVGVLVIGFLLRAGTSNGSSK